MSPHLSVINDSFGRHTGDRLLQCVADRLKAHFPDTEQLAHLGGGTFVCMNASRERAETETRTLHDDITRIFARPSASMAARSSPRSRVG